MYNSKKKAVIIDIKKYAWIFTLLVAIGGLWLPKLGLLVIFVMGSLTITAFLTGRLWCGNFCPHGSLFDTLIKPISRNKNMPEFLKSRAMITIFFIFFMFSFSKKLVNVIKTWGSLGFLDRLGSVFVTTYLMVLIVGGVLAMFIKPRTWCQFCPMGTIQKLSYTLGKATGVNKNYDKKITISDQEKCISCAKCSKACPFQLTPFLEFSHKNQFDNINCIKCSTCVESCPTKILSLEKARQ